MYRVIMTLTIIPEYSKIFMGIVREIWYSYTKVNIVTSQTPGSDSFLYGQYASLDTEKG